MALHDLTDVQRNKYDAYVRLRTSGVEILHIATALAKEFGIKRASIYKFLKNKKVIPLIDAYENKVEKLEADEVIENGGKNIASIGWILQTLQEQVEDAKNDGELRHKITRTIIEVRQKFQSDTEDYMDAIQKLGSGELIGRAIESFKKLFGNEATRKALTEAIEKESICTT